MKRNIIKIDEKKCNGCGVCIPECPEGALQIIDGKARLVSDLFCDGLGACIGECPEGAISVEEREAEPYDELRVMENIVKQGDNTIKAHLKHLKDHNETGFLNMAIEYLKEKNYEKSLFEEFEAGETIQPLPCGCPGSMTQDLSVGNAMSTESLEIEMHSELRNWPVQLQLINPNAHYFKGEDLLISADCVPFTYSNFHHRFIRDKILIMFCPKLDKTIDEYIGKLTEIFKNKSINSISVVRMEVPCCSGIERIIEMAQSNAGTQIPVEAYTISVKGEILKSGNIKEAVLNRK